MIFFPFLFSLCLIFSCHRSLTSKRFYIMQRNFSSEESMLSFYNSSYFLRFNWHLIAHSHLIRDLRPIFLSNIMRWKRTTEDVAYIFKRPLHSPSSIVPSLLFEKILSCVPRWAKRYDLMENPCGYVADCLEGIKGWRERYFFPQYFGIRRLHVQDPYLLYSSHRDGYNLRTFVAKNEGNDATILLLRTSCVLFLFFIQFV